MATVNVYLIFENQCEEAFNFYKSVFGGEFEMISRFNEIPAGEEAPAMPEADGNNIMHVSLPIGNGTSLMGSDTGGEWSGRITMGNNFSISINTDSKEEADRLYQELSAGGKETMPMADTFWGSYFGMFTDKFEINWMVSYGQ